MEMNTKKCPYCKEEIVADAVKCKYCGEFLDGLPADSRKPVAPENYLVWAILSTVLCCLPFGVVSIVYASQVDSAYSRGDYDEAERCSRRARSWMLASVISSVVISVLYIILVALGVAAGVEMSEIFG